MLLTTLLPGTDSVPNNQQMTVSRETFFFFSTNGTKNVFSVQLGCELLPESKELKFWVLVQSCRMDTVEVVWSSDHDASWVPPLGGFQGTSDWEDTLGQTKNLLGRLHISPGIPQEERFQVCWAKGCPRPDPR